MSVNRSHLRAPIIPVLILFSCLASGADTPTSAKPAILPSAFAGWQIGNLKTSSDAGTADPVNAGVLKEYGFTDFAGATYQRDGEKMTVRAARFADASGAYGAFTFYKVPQMLNEKIGDQASSWNERVLFYKGNVLIDAVIPRMTAMSAADLRELAGTLPLPTGNEAKLPSLPEYLPKLNYEKNTAKYVLGPEGLQKIGSPLSAEQVGFDTGAEVVLGKFAIDGGESSLVIISYPTPQIAAERLRRLDGQSATATATSSSGPLFSKRTGPLVAVVAGPVSKSAAQGLLGLVNYQADVTWNENTHFTAKDNIGNLIVNVLLLCGIIGAFAIISGIAFGGMRVLVKHYWPDRVFDRPEDVEFLSLHLSDGDRAGPPDRAGS